MDLRKADRQPRRARGQFSCGRSQYAGPSVLSRGGGGGVAPLNTIAIRPYINISGISTSGLLTGAVRPDGSAASEDAFGGEAAVGLYGHSPTKHLTFSLREGAGTFTQNFSYTGTFGFYDPSFAHIPQDEPLDRRTTYVTTMADVTYFKSARLSFNFGATGFVVRRERSALYGVVGATARADAAYRLSRRSTVAVDYFFTTMATARHSAPAICIPSPRTTRSRLRDGGRSASGPVSSASRASTWAWPM